MNSKKLPFIVLCSLSFVTSAKTTPVNLADATPVSKIQWDQISLSDDPQASVSTSMNPKNQAKQKQYQTQARQGLLLPSETPVQQLLPVSSEGQQPPYGANLFAGGYETERMDGLNDDYLIAAGDKISIWLWGAINLSEVVTVDNQGNIFLPNIGPINVKNVPASRINQVVTQKIRTVYKANVNIYVNLLTATPVSIFVSGSVVRPGQYAGVASDSILYYLKRAGGIDSERGSYRAIRVMRNGKILKQIDLYQFIKSASIARFNFKDGDVIFVENQKSTVNVTGIVRNPFRFEFEGQNIKGKDIIEFAKPYAKASHVGVMGTRNQAPYSTYMDIQSFEKFEVKDGDKLIFNDDLRAEILDIQLKGSYLGPSYYAVNKTTRLKSLLANVEVNPELADFDSIYVLRRSVAERQREMIEQSLQRLERSTLTAPVSSDGEALIRARETQMILSFTDRARKIQPLGKVVVTRKGKVSNILLEQGDIIVIPEKSDLIQIGGEVMMPQAVVYHPKMGIDDYVDLAGGYSERANEDQPMILKANGIVTTASNTRLEPGDQILILPKVDTKLMQSVKDLTQIVYQIAVAANVIVK